MKKIALIMFSLLSVISTKAGENDDLFTLNIGFLFNSTLNATFGYERELSYGNALELYGEVGNRWHKDPKDGKIYKDDFWKDYYWDGGLLYKKVLRRHKNSVFRARLGPHFGAHTAKYFFGVEGGFEYNYIFSSGIQLSLIQKNEVNFLHGDTFRNGLLVGVKIPF
ncbi:MAG: hypothetical protein J5918_07415 [Prevotella sp.]|nr:hypothetical protein [Prevotella sp.]